MTTPSRAKSSTRAPTVRVYLRQSEGEEKQQSTTTQVPLADACLDRLRAAGAVDASAPVERYTDVGCARYDWSRPGFLRLMADVQKGDVVIVAWRDRLGSGPRYVVAVEDIVKVRGARLYIADPYEEILWDKTRGLVESIHASQSAAYVEDLKVKTRAALRRLLANGYAAGPVGFGYTTEPDPTTRKVVGGVERFHKRILIDESERELILRIFTMRANGDGWARMSKALNREGLRTSEGGHWAAGSLYDVIFNTRYVGEWPVGERKIVKRGGKRVGEAGDAPEVIKLPHLAIVPRELWDKAHAVSEARHTDMRGNVNAAKHLLSGVLRCRECAGALSVMHAPRGRYPLYYVCSRHRRTGACPVKMHVPAPPLEDAIRSGAAEILSAAEDVIRKVVREVVARRTSERKADAGAVGRELEAARVKLVKARKLAYATGDDSEDTIDMLRRLGERVKELEADAARASAPVDLRTPAEIERETLSRLADLRKALSEHPARAREALHRMFPAGIPLRVTAEAYEIEANADLAHQAGSRPAAGRQQARRNDESST